jgi:hypothetical protein
MRFCNFIKKDIINNYENKVMPKYHLVTEREVESGKLNQEKEELRSYLEKAESK